MSSSWGSGSLISVIGKAKEAVSLPALTFSLISENTNPRMTEASIASNNATPNSCLVSGSLRAAERAARLYSAVVSWLKMVEISTGVATWSTVGNSLMCV